MLEEYTLKSLCDKYNISPEYIVDFTGAKLTQREYKNIDKTLNYLISELKIGKEDIEACPSIVCRNADMIESNLAFLNKHNLSFPSIRACLYVLSAKSIDLKETYEYVSEIYGVETIKEIPTILGCNKSLIKAVETLDHKDKKLNLALAVGANEENLKATPTVIPEVFYANYYEEITPKDLAKVTIEAAREMLPTMEELKKILDSECREHSELFMSAILDYANIEDVRKILQGEEYRQQRQKSI